MIRYPNGSEWRKWDLHVHPPGTKLGDCYKKESGEPDLPQFCEIIYDSEVFALGITDYFSFDGFFSFKQEYENKYGNDATRVFFPNLELRLPQNLNQSGQSVNIHLLFRPDLTEAEAEKFLTLLVTESTADPAQKEIRCKELSTKADFETATVSLPSIETAIRGVFGRKATIEDHVLIVTAATGDGIQPGGTGSKARKNRLVDEIDKRSHGFFGNPGSRDHFLNPKRLETDELVAPKPVFAGCDAHSFPDLKNWLGAHVTKTGQEKHITWIKADLTFEGLQQTLIEPEHRIAVQPIEPDQKEPYKYISAVTFSGSNDFPDRIPLNRNLNAIIGSRSSGKSALLAFIAHAVDPDHTLEQQAAASNLAHSELGPAAGKSWSDVEHIDCTIEWGDPDTTQGKVIYIPQNSLYEISERPDAITAKIQPALFRAYPKLGHSHEHLLSELKAGSDSIVDAIDRWFSLAESIDSISEELQDIGDKKAITEAIKSLQGKIDKLKKTSELSDDDIKKYQEIVADIGSKNDRLDEIEVEEAQLEPYVESTDGSAGEFTPSDGAPTATIELRPSHEDLPAAIQEDILDVVEKAEESVSSKISKLVTNYRETIHKEKIQLRKDIKGIEKDNAKLIAKNKANAQLEELVDKHKKEKSALKKIQAKEKELRATKKKQNQEEKNIEVLLSSRKTNLSSLTANFKAEERRLNKLMFDIEIDFEDEQVSEKSLAFNKNASGDYVDRDSQCVDHEKARSDPGDFLKSLHDGTQRLNIGYDPDDVARDVLTLVPEVRFNAELEGDRIGGFGRPSMTPGKQALFALTLLLHESDEPWPLLIDQPEDDLDSRSIYDTIVPYLVDSKSERQIIMVSHNANLVVGADSEEVIVANRHGDDRKNKGSKTFDYLTGSLEHSVPIKKAPTVLETCGIREHACEILDGGEEAFQKRKDKYKI